MLYHDDASYRMLDMFDSKTFDSADWLIVLKRCESFDELANTKLVTSVDW